MDELAFRWAKQRPDESQVEMACGSPAKCGGRSISFPPRKPKRAAHIADVR